LNVTRRTRRGKPCLAVGSDPPPPSAPTMPTPATPSRSVSDARHPLRLVLIWGAFVVTLAVGLVLAVVHGRGVPVLLDVVAR